MSFNWKLKGNLVSYCLPSEVFHVVDSDTYLIANTLVQKVVSCIDDIFWIVHFQTYEVTFLVEEIHSKDVEYPNQ